MTAVHEDMTAKIGYEKLVIFGPEQVVALYPLVVYSNTLVQFHP